MKSTAILHSRAYAAIARLSVGIALLLAPLPSSSLAKSKAHSHRPVIIEFDESQIFLEENGTDGDLGIHFKVDGEPWDRLTLYGPGWTKLVDIKVKGSSGVIGLTELFNESAEEVSGNKIITEVGFETDE